MKKAIICFLTVMLTIFSLATFAMKDAHADSCVTSAKVYWEPGWSWQDDNGVWHAKFDVDLTFGEACKNYQVADEFWCNDGGANLDEWGGSVDSTGGGEVDSGNISTTDNGTDSEGRYWRLVNITPPYSDWQPLQGWIYAEPDEPDITTFSGKVKIKSSSYSNGTGTGDGSLTVGFTDTIKRTDKVDIASSSNYQKQISYKIKRAGGDWGSTTTTNWSSAKSISLNKGESSSFEGSDSSYTVTGLHPGDSAQICQRLKYSSKVAVSSDGTQEVKKTATTKWSCKNKTLPIYTLNIEGKYIYNNNNLDAGDQTVTGYGAKTVTRNKLYDKNPPFRFVCWKTSSSAGLNGCITTTSTSKDPYVLDLTSGSYIRYHKNLTSNHTVYAYYARIYKLTIESDDHSSVTVSRENSPYANAGTGTLSNGASIYKGDKLKISTSVDGCQSNGSDYAQDTFTVTGATLGSDGLYTVDGDTEVVIKSKDQSKTLTVHYRDISSSSDSIHDDNRVKVCKGNSARTTRPSISGYGFVGWKTVSWSGYASTYCNGSTNCTGSTLSSMPLIIAGKGVTNLQYAFSDYQRNTMDSNHEVYAVYAKKHTLTLNAGAYTSITVKRTSSPYAHAADATWSAESINSSSAENKTATIYDGDILSINFSKLRCYKWTAHRVKAPSNEIVWGNGNSLTVTSDVEVRTTAELRSYTFTRSEAGHSHAYVYRISSPYGGGSTSSTNSLGNGDTLYCGDTIRATFSLDPGYSWGNYNWNNNANQWGYHFSGEAGKTGDSWDETGPKSGSSNDPTDHSEHTLPSSGTYTVDGNVLVETQTILNQFRGRARSDEGATIGSGAAGTDWQGSTDSTVTKKIECANSGCTGTIELAAYTLTGTGLMTYKIGRSSNGGSINWGLQNFISPAASRDNPTILLNDVLEGNAILRPGQSKCQTLRFTPSGASTTTKDVTACIDTTVSTFEGKSSLSGNFSGSVGFTGSTSSRTYYVDNCTNGCSVSFSHELKRTQGIGSTDYTVSRTSNLTSTTRKIDDNPSVASGTFRPSTDTSKNNVATSVSTDPSSGSFTLYPGMKVCETLTFKPNNNTVTTASNVSTTVCALALGNAQPDDPTDPNTPNDPDDPSSDPNGNTGSNAFIDIEVRRGEKNDGTNMKYGTYRRIIYAKPSDTITYKAYYNPTLQYTYYLVPQKMQVNGGTLYPTGVSVNSKTVGELYDLYKGSSLSTWTNRFSVQKKINSNNNFNSATLIANYTNYTVGAISSHTETNSVSVTGGNAGQSIDERAVTNLNSSTQTTPSQVEFFCSATGDNSTCTGNNAANVLTAAKSNIAYARIPYNFKTSVEITTPENTPIYAGEETQIDAKIIIQPKPNSKTMDSGDRDYATKVGNPKYKIIVYQGNQHGGGDYTSDDLCRVVYGLSNDGANCGYSAEVNSDDAKKNINGSDENNPSIKLYENTVRNVNRTFYAQDLNAGSEICVSIAFWPASSGANTNYNDPDGSKSWRVSPSKCYTVAKKPSLQIWGGNVYSTGIINVATSVKNNLAGYTNYDASSVSTQKDYNYVFGSWGELGIVSAGKVTGFASGAKTGYARKANSDNDPLWPSYIANAGQLVSYGPGGSKEGTGNTSICLRSTLTFANYRCNASSSDYPPGKLSGTTISSNGNRDKTAIIASLMKEGIGVDHNVSGSVTLNDASKDNKLGAYYYKSASDLAIPGASIDAGTTQIVNAEGSITISGDLRYQEPAGGYTKLSDIPKLIIYTKSNIYINCNVAYIDAVLIAEGSVTTCGNVTSVSDSITTINNPENSTQLFINGAIIADKLIANRTYGSATGSNSIVPAEIINYDATLYMWGANQADVSESGKLNVTYTRELAPRY